MRMASLLPKQKTRQGRLVSVSQSALRGRVRTRPALATGKLGPPAPFSWLSRLPTLYINQDQFRDDRQFHLQ